MEADYEKRLNDLLVEAFELPAAERKAFLLKATDGDEVLYREALACIDHEGEVGDFLETPALESRTDAPGLGALTTEARRGARTRGERRPRAREEDGRIHLSWIGPYKVLGRLGIGGMGVVYRAEDTRLERTVAIKFLTYEASHDDRAESRFLREARAVARLDHPNICSIYEIGNAEDGRPYMVMACYEGESLQERLRRGPLPPEEAVRILRQVASGLAAAHRQGIVHRDVKPANVFLTHDVDTHSGGVKILDFGIAKVTGDAGLTSPGRFIGTPYYMAPEQMSGLADQRSDIWALGVLLYEMVSGKKPFSGPRAIQAVLREPPPPLAAERPDLPDFVYRIVERALDKEPSRRYQSVDELVDELPEETSVTISALDVTAAVAIERRRSRRRLALAAAIVTVVLAAGGLATLRLHDGADTRMDRLASLTTESSPALESYRLGERAWQEGRFADAAREFEMAVAHDPAFALAWYRLSAARNWLLDVEGSQEALAEAIRHADRLSPDDRRLLEGVQATGRGDFEAAERLCLEVLTRRPDDLEAWVALGEAEFHLGPLFGRSLRYSRESWERVLTLEPDERQGLLHLARIDLYERDFAALRRRSQRLRTLLEGSERASEPLFFLAMTPDADDERDGLHELLMGSELGIQWLTAGFTLSAGRDLIDIWASFHRELAAPEHSARERAFAHRHLGIFALASGRLAEAEGHFAFASPPPEAKHEYLALAATVPFLPVSSARLAELVRTVESWSAEPTAEFSLFRPHAHFPAHRRLYVLALLAARAGDLDRALALAGELAALAEVEAAPGLVSDLTNGVRAEIAFRQGRHEEVLELLAERHGRYSYEFTLMSPFFAQARERYLKAESLSELGRPQEALAWYETLAELNVFDLAYLGLSHRRRAEIYDRLGDTERAVEQYQRFVELWSDADPELRPWVEEARRRLTSLR